MMIQSRATSDGVIRVYLAGEIDMATVDDVQTALRAAVAGDGTSKVVADLAEVTFCDSSGIAALDRVYSEATRRDIGFQVANPQPGVQRVLEITGLLKHLLE